MAEEKATPVSLLLKRGESWQQEGNIYRAKDTFFRIMENFPDTEEAKKAEARLFSMAQGFEEEGKVYAAMSIYERLATPPAPRIGLRILSPGGRPM